MISHHLSHRSALGFAVRVVSILFSIVFHLTPGIGALAVSAQTATQIWPEGDVYLSFSKYTRLSAQGAQVFDDGKDIVSSKVGIYLDTAPMLLITQMLHTNNDIFRERYVVLRLGYSYTTSFAEFKKSSHENRPLVAISLRIPWGKHVSFTHRSQGEFRFFSHQFSPRYRAKFRIEADVNPAKKIFTPYLSTEFFYDTRFNVFNRQRYEAGIEFPLSHYIKGNPYYTRQHDSEATPQRVNAAGLTLSFYF